MPSAEMFSSYGDQISGVLRTLVVIVVLTVALSLALMAVIFLMSVHDRRRQIGVLRALGATQRFVLLAYMTEAAVLAVAGGLAGAVLAAVVVYFFHDLLVSALGFTILLPSVLSMIAAGRSSACSSPWSSPPRRRSSPPCAPRAKSRPSP